MAKSKGEWDVHIQKCIDCYYCWVPSQHDFDKYDNLKQYVLRDENGFVYENQWDSRMIICRLNKSNKIVNKRSSCSAFSRKIKNFRP